MSRDIEQALLKASREASAYFDRFDRSSLYNAAAHLNVDWLLSDMPPSMIVEPQNGLITNLSPPDKTGRYTLLYPKCKSSDIRQFRMQEVHQILRELIEGIYVFNQTPSISLDSNYDSTTSISIMSAYNDTLVGEALFAVDYYMKSLLHGSTVAQKENRAKLLGDWKKFPQHNLRGEFLASGMTMMIEDKELGKHLYEEKRPPRTRYPSKCIKKDLATRQLSPRLTTGEEHEQVQAHLSRETFLHHLDQVRLGLAFRQDKILQGNGNVNVNGGGVLLMESVHEVVTKVLAMADNNTSSSSSSTSARLHAYLQKQRDFVSKNLLKKVEISHYVELLGLVSSLVHLLATLKRQGRIVDVKALIPARSKDVMRTERDIPPTMPTPSSRWSPFLSKNSHTGVHGDVDFLKGKITAGELCVSPSELEAICKHSARTDSAKKSITSISSMEKEIPTCTLDRKEYYIIVLEVEPYYSKLPRWVHAMSAELKNQSIRLPQINDIRIQELLRKPLGPRKASTMKTVNVSLQASVVCNLLPAVTTLLKRCTHTRLRKEDEMGMTLLHYAATNARPDAISALLIGGSDVHQTVKIPGEPDSLSSPLHLASRTGDVESVCCLVYFGADLCALDASGWAPIHHAAYHNCQTIIRYLFSLTAPLVDMKTANKLQTTPILLSAQNGCFDSFKCLVELGADIGATTSDGSNVIHYAALRHHMGILKYLVERRDERADVWGTLSDMLKSDARYTEVAAQNLDPLTRWRPKCWEDLLQCNAIDSLVQLMMKTETLQLVSVQVLANLSYMEEVKLALVKTEAVPTLVKLLSSSNDWIQVSSCLVLSDLAILPDAQEDIAKAGAIPHLNVLMQSKVDDVQLFSCACIGILADENPKNQVIISEAGSLPTLVTLLKSPIPCIQSCASNTLQAVLKGNRSNQLTALAEQTIGPLVNLLRSKDPSIFCNAARTIESLAYRCAESQQEMLANSVCINLLKRLLKMRDYAIKVAGGCALWAIAGILISNKRLIATHMGLELLVDMLTVHNEKLDFVCSEALGALATELGDNQNQIIHVGGVKPLVEVLTITPTSQKVCLSVIHTLSTICMKPALVPNNSAQTAIGSARGVVILSTIVSSKDTSDIVRVEAACTLAKLLLNNSTNDKILARHTDFSFLTIFKFFTSPDPLVRLLAGSCLSIMAFNNPDKLREMGEIGSINISNFIPFLHSEDQFYQIHSAFQIVVLSKLLTGIDDVDAVVKGIKLLVYLLSSDAEQTKVLSAEYIASLSRSGRGLPGALVMAATLDALMVNLSVGNGPVIESTCVALGYLTFHPMASRLIIGMFRDNPELFVLFKQYFPLIVYSEKFLENWNHITRRGIPTLRYVDTPPGIGISTWADPVVREGAWLIQG